jgi:hypothetical protein
MVIPLLLGMGLMVSGSTKRLTGFPVPRLSLLFASGLSLNQWGYGNCQFGPWFLLAT